jgi:branched-chain amino acid transport system ATP-binding protein
MSAPTSSTDAKATTRQLLLRSEEIVAGYVPEVDILRGCSITVHDGDLVGIIGPNGAGKSTLVKAMFGLLPIRSGTIELRNENIVGLAAHELVAKGVGYVPQVRNVFPTLTVAENLEMGVYLRPKEYSAAFDRVSELFPLLKDRRKQRAGSLSGGERQMLAMGRALMMDPEVLFLDEPSAGLAPMAQEEVFDRVQQINQAGVSMIMVEQNAHRCLQICDRGYVLDQGQNAYTGTGQELLHDPKVIELYLGTLAQEVADGDS